MKNPWMLSLKKNTINKKVLELYFYFYFLNKFFFVYSFCLIRKLNFFSNFVKKNSSLFLGSKITEKLKNLKTIPNHMSFKVSSKVSILSTFPKLQIDTNKKFYYSEKFDFTQYRLMSLFFIFNYSLFNSVFKINYNFKLFYITDVSKQIVILDLKKFFKRWKDSYDLLFNMFYYNMNPLIFGSPFFKQEIYSLNWHYSDLSINFWRYYFPFFTFKLNNYNKKTDFFFDKLGSFGVNFFLITDCYYHFKNLYFFKKKHYYTIGLVNVNSNPWMVSYPIVSFFESLLTQSFFFKLLLFIEKQTHLYKYSNFKKIWLTFLNNKNNI